MITNQAFSPTVEVRRVKVEYKPAGEMKNTTPKKKNPHDKFVNKFVHEGIGIGASCYLHLTESGKKHAQKHGLARTNFSIYGHVFSIDAEKNQFTMVIEVRNKKAYVSFKLSHWEDIITAGNVGIDPFTLIRQVIDEDGDGSLLHLGLTEVGKKHFKTEDPYVTVVVTYISKTKLSLNVKMIEGNGKDRKVTNVTQDLFYRSTNLKKIGE